MKNQVENLPKVKKETLDEIRSNFFERGTAKFSSNMRPQK